MVTLPTREECVPFTPKELEEFSHLTSDSSQNLLESVSEEFIIETT